MDDEQSTATHDVVVASDVDGVDYCARCNELVHHGGNRWEHGRSSATGQSAACGAVYIAGYAVVIECVRGAGHDDEHGHRSSIGQSWDDK